MLLKRLLIFVSAIMLLVSCNTDDNTNNNTNNNQNQVQKISAPDFIADSAYKYVADQVAFGARVPNTPAHAACALYLQNSLTNFGAEVIVQEAKVKAYNGTMLNIKNIIGQYNTENPNRILLFAHWDSRHIADHDPDFSKRNQPILGANDGASGVGVLLEIARQISIKLPNIGIDIIFFDAEDYGDPVGNNMESWCLGSQYWAANKHKENYFARFGILLDMVGGKGAMFTRESLSMNYAPAIVEKVWKTAQRIGYGSQFVDQRTHFVGTDDHVPVNEIALIPSVNIVQYNPSNGGFGDYWHTHNDNLDAIDKNTLKAVGQTVMEVIYSEN